jgi:DNA-binding MarR family transcriptional regulator
MKRDKIKNGNYLTKYFTQFPNIIDDSDLSPFEFRVLLHYYRVGECWEGVRTTASKCKMSTGKVSDARKSLEEKGYIKISPLGDGVTIDVVDKTKENLDKYRSPDEPTVHAVNDGVHLMNAIRSPDEHKNNPVKNNQEEVIGASATKTFDERKNDLRESIRPHVKEFSVQMLKQFFEYWTEPNKTKTKMRFELEKTWETKRRLVRWKQIDELKKKKPGHQDQSTPVFRPEGTNNQDQLDIIERRIQEQKRNGLNL